MTTYVFDYSCLVSVVPYFEKTPMPNPRLSARSIWSWHAGTQKPTMTRHDTSALSSAVSSPSRHEVPPPPVHWLRGDKSEDNAKQLGVKSEDDAKQLGGKSDNDAKQLGGVNVYDDVRCRRGRYGGSACSDNSDNMSEFSDSSESTLDSAVSDDGVGVTSDILSMFHLQSMRMFKTQ